MRTLTMLTQELLREVEREVVARNHEVSLFLVKRLCHHQKFRLKLCEFIKTYGNVDWIEEEMLWRSKRRMQKKITFSDPCYRCPACRNDPRLLARLLGVAQPS